MTGAWILFIFVAVMSAAILALLHRTSLGDLPETRRDRQAGTLAPIYRNSRDQLE
jgi:hypothetical protein